MCSQRSFLTWKFTFTIVCFVQLSLSHQPALADEEKISQEVYIEITATTPSRLEEPAEEVSGSVTILTEPIIETQKPVAVPELLRDFPGVNIRESGTLGEQAAFRLRGTEPFQTLVLLDGIRLNSPFRGFFDLGNFLIDNIGQIEVIRGAQSSLYGSEAMGGVINLKTRVARLKQEAFVLAEGGSFTTYREGFGLAGNRSWGDYNLTFSKTDSNGQFARDRFDAITFSSRLKFDLTPKSSLLMIPRFQEDKKELAVTALEFMVPMEFVYDENSKIERRFFSNVLSYRHEILPWWEMILKGGFVQTHLDWDNPADPSPAIPFSYFEETHERELSVDLQQNFTWLGRQVFTLGVEYAHDDVKSDLESNLFPIPVAIDAKRQNRAAYLQQLFKWDRQFVFQIGTRIDDDSRFGSVVNPKVSAAYEFMLTKTRIRGSWGYGFRAPTIQELDFPLVGNPALEPERSRNWEVGGRQRFLDGSVDLDIVYFQADFEDIILRGPPPIGAVNVAKAQSRGIEAELSIQPFRMVQIKGNYTYLDTEEKSTGEELPFRPRNRWNLNLLFFPLVNLVFNLDVNIVSSQSLHIFMVNNNGDVQKIPLDFILLDGSLLQDSSPGYMRVDLAISYELLRGFSYGRIINFFAKLNNLFDRNYQDVPGFPAPGRGISGGITVIL